MCESPRDPAVGGPSLQAEAGVVLYSSGYPHLTRPGPRHRAQLSEVMAEAWGGALFPKELRTAFWDRMICRRRHRLAFLFTCVTQPSSCRAQQLLEVQEKYLISSRHRSPRSNVSRDDGQGEASGGGRGRLSILSSLRREKRGGLFDHN